MSDTQHPPDDKIAPDIDAVVGSIRRSLAGAGEDLNTLEQALENGMPAAARQAVSRLRRHLEVVEKTATSLEGQASH